MPQVPLYHVKSMRMTYDGGLSGSYEVAQRQGIRLDPPEVPGAVGTALRMTWGNAGRHIVNISIPASINVGDQMVVFAVAQKWTSASAPAISGGWTLVLNGDLSSNQCFKVWKRIKQAGDTSLTVSAGPSHAVYMVGAKLLYFSNVQLGSVISKTGSNSIVHSMTNPNLPLNSGRLLLGGGAGNDTGKGIISGGSGSGVSLVEDGNPPSGTWRSSTAIFFDPLGTNHSYTYSVPNSSARLAIIEVTGTA